MTNSENGTATDQSSAQATDRPIFLREGVSKIGFFSPHHMSHGQAEQIEQMTGRSMSDVVDMSDLASRHINTHQEVQRVWSHISARIEEMLEGAETAVLFGVFPPPIRAQFRQWSTRSKSVNVHLLESFNSRVNRDGRGPDFNHIDWVETGRYDLKFPSA